MKILLLNSYKIIRFPYVEILNLFIEEDSSHEKLYSHISDTKTKPIYKNKN
jgi:hypothetical protein